MSRMVRKQIYIEEEQDAALKEMAEEYGVSQAELIRQAVEQKIAGRRRVRVRYPEKIRKKALDEGMITLIQNGLKKVYAGLTTIEEVLRVTSA